MSAFTVIAGVTRTLGEFLKAETGVNVDVDRSPAAAIADTPPLIHLYLYRVEPNPFFENNDWLEPSPTSLQAQPLGVNLCYLVTPYANGQLQIQMLLGQVMQVFHQTPIIPSALFDPALIDTTEELRVSRKNVSLETMTEFWRAFDGRSYRLGVVYEASVALISSNVVRTVQRVQERAVRVEPLR